MALWKKAFARLRGGDVSSSGQPVEAAGSDVLEQDDVAIEESLKAATQMAADAELEADNLPFVAPDAQLSSSELLSGELQQGMQVSLGDLQSSAAGWCYRGHPVMVFGVENTTIDDPSRRRQLASLVHLFPCSNALKDEGSTAWVATERGALEKVGDPGQFRFCPGCLQAAAGRGADAATFQFIDHVRSHGDSYFPGGPCYWRPGMSPVELMPPAADAEQACPQCRCHSRESGWQLNAEDAERLSLPEGICLLCAERQVDGCLHYEADDLLSAAQIRYRDLMAQASRPPVASWKLAAAILPQGWQPLLRSLERMLPPPELFFRFSESEPPAVLAWPALRRGVVERRAEGQAGKDWSLWTRAQIESELGFALR